MQNKKIHQRKIDILKIIIGEYIKTGGITGSKSLLKKFELGVSSATVRNDMGDLEKMGLIFQPYNSAGRLPTTRGIRVFVDYLIDTNPGVILDSPTNFESADDFALTDHLYDLTNRVSSTTKEITFCYIPEKRLFRYVGIPYFLQKNKNTLEEQEILQILALLEDKEAFSDILTHLDTSNKINLYIGEENIISTLKNCSLIVKKITLNGSVGYLGILSSLRCDYAYNIQTLKNILSC